MSSTANPATCRIGRRTTRATYWAAADENERANGRLFRDIEFALPKELSERQQVALAREVRGLGDHRHRRAVALHAGRASWRVGEPPRASDVLRAGERRHHAASPSSGFAGTTPRLRTKAGPRNPRRQSRRRGLSRPARAGRSRRTARWSGRGARIRFTLGAWRSSSPRPSTAATPTRSRAWRIGSRGCISVHTTSQRVERGESLERVAEVGSVEDRNQALAVELGGRVPHGAGPATRAG